MTAGRGRLHAGIEAGRGVHGAMTEVPAHDFVAARIAVQVHLGGDMPEQVQVHMQAGGLEDMAGDLVA